MTPKRFVKDIRSICLEVAEDAPEAAKKTDVSFFDKESYIAGYQDGAIDVDEAILDYLHKHGLA